MQYPSLEGRVPPTSRFVRTAAVSRAADLPEGFRPYIHLVAPGGGGIFPRAQTHPVLGLGPTDPPSGRGVDHGRENFWSGQKNFSAFSADSGWIWWVGGVDSPPGGVVGGWV